MKTKVRPIRVGDRCRVVVPEFVVRVGYPMTLDGEQKAVLETYRREIEDFLSRLGAMRTLANPVNKSVWRIAREVAFQRCHINGWGGRMRTIHTVRIEEQAGMEFEVQRVRFVKTGEYVPAKVWDGEYESAYLADSETHRLLELPFCANTIEHPQIRGGFLEIEAKNVERIDTISTGA